jgi:hypothetical protein|tara:strand:+ start:339 stop:611 length:273 start_codon:yes stop_codon:yes gene_type:complete
MNLQELKGKSLEDLRVISKLVQGMIDIRKSELVWEMKENLKVGNIVTVPHGKLKGKKLRVDKINIKKAVLSILDETQIGQWNVPLSMIES